MIQRFKEYCFKYKDDLKAFLEMELEKVKYFRDLSMITKQELIYNMERRTYNQGDHIYSVGESIMCMIVIQSGVVQLSTLYDKRKDGADFIVERLTAGAILNHNAFMVKDIADTDYVCRTPVSCFALTYDKMKQVMLRRADLQQANKEVKRDVFMPKYNIALDYIFHN